MSVPTSSSGGESVPTYPPDKYYMCKQQADKLAEVLQPEHPRYWGIRVVSRYSGWDYPNSAISSLWCSRANAVRLFPLQGSGNPMGAVVLYPYKFWDGPAPVKFYTWEQFIFEYPNELDTSSSSE